MLIEDRLPILLIPQFRGPMRRHANLQVVCYSYTQKPSMCRYTRKHNMCRYSQGLAKLKYSMHRVTMHKEKIPDAGASIAGQRPSKCQPCFLCSFPIRAGIILRALKQGRLSWGALNNFHFMRSRISTV